MRDLGRLGENTFSVWCSQVGLVANPSIIDKTGWDFYVQFPITDDLSVSKLHKPAFECRVQVKATDSRDRKWQITLSNLRQMATASMPTFYCFLEFDNKNEVQKAFLLHVDSKLIYSILKKIHAIEQSDKDNNLNKRKMTIHYGMDEQIKILDGENLKKSLLNFIGDDYPKYLENKNNFLKKCGFEDGECEVKFTLIGKDSLQKIVDVSLGLKEEIEVRDVISTEKRFGISAKNPNLMLPQAKLKIPNTKGRKGKIRFKQSKFSMGIVFPMELYLAPFTFNDYREFTKFRVVGSFFDIVCEPYKNMGIYNFHIMYDQKYLVKEIRDAIDMILLMSTADKNIIVALEFENYPTLDFKLKTKHLDHDLDYSSEILKKVEEICTSMGLSNEVKISLQDIYDNEEKIHQLHALLKENDAISCSVKFKTDTELKKELTISIFVIVCKLGDHFAVLIVSTIGKAEKISKDEYEIKECEIVVEQEFNYTVSNIMTNEDIIEEINKIATKYKDAHNTFSNLDIS